MERVCWYLDKYADEVMPARLQRPTLEGWAAWLAGGGERGNPDYEDDREPCAWCFDPPADGTEYDASSLTFEEDIIATRSDDGETISYSRPIPADIDFVAARFGPGMGWEPESILDPTCSFGGSIDQQLVETIMLEKGESADLAIARRATHKLRYCATPARLEIVGNSA